MVDPKIEVVDELGDFGGSEDTPENENDTVILVPQVAKEESLATRVKGGVEAAIEAGADSALGVESQELEGGVARYRLHAKEVALEKDRLRFKQETEEKDARLEADLATKKQELELTRSRAEHSNGVVIRQLEHSHETEKNELQQKLNNEMERNKLRKAFAGGVGALLLIQHFALFTCCFFVGIGTLNLTETMVELVYGATLVETFALAHVVGKNLFPRTPRNEGPGLIATTPPSGQEVES